MRKIGLLFTLVTMAFVSQAQVEQSNDNYLTFSWARIVRQMPEIWYGSADAIRVAENVVFCQKEIGGWEKNKPYHHTLTEAETAEVKANKSADGATIDNGATTSEMIFLAKVYVQKADERWWSSFEKGFNYLIAAQYPNGGWPQFYPLRKGYYTHITYNDNAMVNVLQMMKDIVENKPLYAALPITAKMKEKAKTAFDKGISCILKTQIIIDGKPTVWCAQHDEVTLTPAKARAYELPSFSGAESMNIVRLLMDIKNPSAEIIKSVDGAMAWMNDHKISGIRVVNKPGADGKRNMVVVEDKDASPLLARFYDLETGKPFFCDRDGVKKSSLAEIGDERRNGYSWYTDGFDQLQVKYSEWVKKVKA